MRIIKQTVKTSFFLLFAYLFLSEHILAFSHSFFFFHKQSTYLFKPAQHIVFLSVFAFPYSVSSHCFSSNFLSFLSDTGCNSAYNWDSICADLRTHTYTHFLSSWQHNTQACPQHLLIRLRWACLLGDHTVPVASDQRLVSSWDHCACLRKWKTLKRDIIHDI